MALLTKEQRKQKADYVGWQGIGGLEDAQKAEETLLQEKAEAISAISLDGDLTAEAKERRLAAVHTDFDEKLAEAYPTDGEKKIEDVFLELSDVRHDLTAHEIVSNALLDRALNSKQIMGTDEAARATAALIVESRISRLESRLQGANYAQKRAMYARALRTGDTTSMALFEDPINESFLMGSPGRDDADNVQKIGLDRDIREALEKRLEAEIPHLPDLKNRLAHVRQARRIALHNYEGNLKKLGIEVARLKSRKR